MNSPKLKVAVVGLGIGRQHAAAYTALPDLFELCALCSIDEPANVLAKADFHVPTVVTSYEDLLRMGELDVIDICTPPMLHKPQVLAALRAGKHVICEKPLTNSLLATDDIIGAEKDSGLRVMPIFQYRFGAGLQKLRALTRSGVSGEPYAASVEVHWRRRADYYAIPWRGKFATELGGALTGHAIHAVDMLTYIFGPVRRVTAMTSTRVNPIQVEDTAAVVVQQHDGGVQPE